MKAWYVKYTAFGDAQYVIGTKVDAWYVKYTNFGDSRYAIRTGIGMTMSIKTHLYLEFTPSGRRRKAQHTSLLSGAQKGVHKSGWRRSFQSDEL